MDSSTKTARKLGKLLADSIQGDDKEQLALQRSAAIVMTTSTPRRDRRSIPTRIVLSGSIAATILVCVASYLLSLSPERMDFWIGDDDAPSEEGQWVRTDNARKTAIRFEGGSCFELQESSTARVVDATVKQVTLDLTDGRLLADVEHKTADSWTVRAGPYRVTVKGTRFSIKWSEDLPMFSVNVEEGQVLVEGPGTGASGVLLTTNESLSTEGDLNRTTIARGEGGAASPYSKWDDHTQPKTPSEFDPLPEVTPGVEDGLQDNQRNKAPGLNTSASSTAAKEPDTAVHHDTLPDWKTFRSTNDYRGAMEAAKEVGLLELANSLNPVDLWWLANAARYARQNDSARDLLLAYRQRFGEKQKASAAAFLLAKQALEHNQSPSEAQHWLEIYLEEAPRGPLSEEALGRLIDVHLAMGKDTDARKAAKLYLERHAGGLFTEQAKKVLNQ